MAQRANLDSMLLFIFNLVGFEKDWADTADLIDLMP